MTYELHRASVKCSSEKCFFLHICCMYLHSPIKGRRRLCWLCTTEKAADKPWKLPGMPSMWTAPTPGIKKKTHMCVYLRKSDPPPSIQQVISPLLIPAYLFRFDWIVCCSRYGQFLTAAETADLLAPDISAYNQVESWLSAGVSAAGNVKTNY